MKTQAGDFGYKTRACTSDDSINIGKKSSISNPNLKIWLTGRNATDMKLSTKGRYAVMAMADIAAQDSGTLVPLLAISERQDISLSYLEQLFNRLRKAGLVASVRGARGGYKLARDAGSILISQIMDAVAEPVSATRCDNSSDQGCRGNERCITHDLWSELDQHINGFLSSISLADVIASSPCGSKAPLARLTTQAERTAQGAAIRAKAG